MAELRIGDRVVLADRGERTLVEVLGVEGAFTSKGRLVRLLRVRACDRNEPDFIAREDLMEPEDLDGEPTRPMKISR